MVLLLWVNYMKQKVLLNVLLILSLSSCDLIDALKGKIDSSESHQISGDENLDTSSEIENEDSSSVDIKDKYEIDEQTWAEELQFLSCNNATINLDFQYSSGNGNVEKHTLKYEIDKDCMVVSQDMDIDGNGNIQTLRQFMDISNYDFLKMYGYGISNGEVIKIYMSQNTFAKNEEEAKEVLMNYFELLIYSSIGHVLLKDQFSTATFDGVDYVIDGSTLSYYAVSTNSYQTNDARIKYHFEDNKLMSINYEEKENKDNKISLMISNRGTTVVEYDTSDACMHEGAYVGSSASSNAHYIECSKCDMPICLQAHTFENGICKYCEYEYEIIDYSQYDLEYLSLKGYPKDAIKIYKDKKTHQVASVVIDMMSSIGYDYENLVFTYTIYGYDVYITKESTSNTNGTTTTYCFYSFEDKKLLQQITYFE